MTTTEQVADRSTEADKLHSLTDHALTDEELDGVTGGIFTYVVASNVIAARAYYQWLKDNDKI
jgi:hypothetical protein